MPPLRSLPVRIRLIQNETQKSLVRRLAKANHLTEWELFGALPRHQPYDDLNLTGLAQLAGYPHRLLQRVVTQGSNQEKMAVSAC